MKKFLSWFMTLVLLISLCACGKYTSSYKSLLLIRSQTSHSCNASFHLLEGRLVFKIKKSQQGTEGDISFSIQAEKGEIHLYYDIYDVKQELAHVKAGESVTSQGGYVEGGYPVYIIIEGTQNAKGKVSVELDHNG